MKLYNLDFLVAVFCMLIFNRREWLHHFTKISIIDLYRKLTKILKMKIIQTKQLAAIDLARKISQIMFKHCYINKKILSYFTELEIQNS